MYLFNVKAFDDVGVASVTLTAAYGNNQPPHVVNLSSAPPSHFPYPSLFLIPKNLQRMLYRLLLKQSTLTVRFMEN